jgi:hypothetical protein
MQVRETPDGDSREPEDRGEEAHLVGRHRWAGSLRPLAIVEVRESTDVLARLNSGFRVGVFDFPGIPSNRGDISSLSLKMGEMPPLIRVPSPAGESQKVFISNSLTELT